MSGTRKLVLAVIDGLKPSMLERAAQSGQAPVLARLMQEGTYVRDCVASFPSVTPVCAATIATGVGPDRHLIPSMNWYHRAEGRYVEYGSSFSASRRFGLTRQLTDTVYNMNGAHLSPDVETVFEVLDDAELRTAGTTYLMYRGRHRHEPARDTPLTRLASAVLPHAVMGPRELFYADIFASRRTGCRSQLGLPGVRDRHSGCVGAYLVEQDLFDFLLLSLPDNDTHSHKYGPHAQVASIAVADRQMERLADAAGGLDAFLEDHAVIVVADHSHAPVEQTIALWAHFEDFAVLQPADPRALDAEIAVCPAQRSAMLYVLVSEGRDALLPRLAHRAREIPGVELAMWRTGEEAVVATRDSELRFAPADIQHAGEPRWQVEGDLGVVGGAIDEDGAFSSETHPDALARVWAALACQTAGDVILSAAPAYEFVDWGGVDHLRGGSHGSLHASDSLAPLLSCGLDGEARNGNGTRSIADVTPMVLAHFGLR
jgi:Type I phosphodiesterase / nucleotide pyrophosphatase